MRRVSTSALLLIVAAGCGPDDATVSWVLAWGTPDLEMRAVNVEAEILEGGCGSTTVLYRTMVEDGAPSMGAAITDLPPGQYGFAANAFDGACQIYARGCTEVTLPPTEDTTVRTVLEADVPFALCDIDECIDGVCQNRMPDAGMDAGVPPMDARVDMDSATPDASMPDSGSDAGVMIPRVCPCGFCFDNPLPTGRDFYGMWGAADDDIWAGGVSGTLQHWDGVRWRMWPEPPGSGTISSMSGSASDDVWAIRSADVLHWDGTSWSLVPRPPTFPRDIWALAPDDVWIAGTGGTVANWNGSAWTTLSSGLGGSLTAIWVRAANDIWTSTESSIAHYDGSMWTTQSLPVVTNLRIRDLYGTGPNDVWASGGSSGVLLRYTGSWSAVSTGATGVSLEFVNGTGPNDVWVTGRSGSVPLQAAHFNGSSWTVSRHPPGWVIPGALAVPSAGKPWTAGAAGHRSRFNGSEWEELQSFSAVHMKGNWGSSEDDVWVVGGTDVYHWDGTSWTGSMPDPTDNDMWDVHGFGTAADDVWVTSFRSFYHWDGMDWSSSGMTMLFATLWGAAPDDIWAVGLSGAIQRYDGSRWLGFSSPTMESLEEVYGFAADDVWAVGRNGVSIHWNGITWSEISTPTSESLEVIWGRAPDDVWAGGQGGALIRWDGTSWRDSTFPSSSRVTGIGGSGPADVLVAVNGGQIYRFDGTNWITDNGCAGISLSEIWSDPTGTSSDAFLFGLYGVAMSRE